MKSNYEKMISGEIFNGADAEILALQAEGAQRKAVLDAFDAGDHEGRQGALADLVGRMDGPCMIKPPFYIEYGRHIRLGKWVFVNIGATFLDSGFITLGDRVAVGPNVQFITVTHPVRPEDRFAPLGEDKVPPFEARSVAHDIVVEHDCWIGAGAIILPGVTIGAGTAVGAGAVVTKSLPARVVAVGNPARVLRRIDD